MGEQRPSTSRWELKLRIVEAASQAFSAHGIKSVKMDDIASSVGISKRTLYELFSDKSDLLAACVQKGKEDNRAFVEGLAHKKCNVLEMVLEHYRWSVENIRSMNRLFFEDMKKYPEVYEELINERRRTSAESIRFLLEGVKQGLFRSDVNYEILHHMTDSMFHALVSSEISNKYSFLEIYENVVFTFLRGIATEKGAAVLESFAKERENNNNN